MSQPNRSQDSSRCCPPVPASILTASRSELTDVKLEAYEGVIPKDLQGHAFFIAPVGSVDSGGLPYPSGNSILNGDGMVYRLDFDKPGEVRVTSRIMKPPCYFADAATRAGSKYDKYKFKNHGILRFSFSLGARNELNTAFLPMQFPGESQDRLLVTYDAGRPYEIDTESLEVITPVGGNKEWRAEANISYPFAPVFSTAHPAFDPHTEQMFTVNYGRSLGNFIESLRFIYELDEIPQGLDEFLGAIAEFIDSQDVVKHLLKESKKISPHIFQLYMQLFGQVCQMEIDNFVYLIRWDGQGNLERWKLVLPDRTPVIIEQTIHQMVVTKDYVVLMDTAFSTGFEQMINNPFPKHKGVEKLFRHLFERPVIPNSTIYIVRRDDLKAGQCPACSQEKEVEVVAQKVVIPLEAAHFLADYDNPEGKITLHIPHICASFVSEWIRTYDQSAYSPHEYVPSSLCGMQQDETDVSRLGRYKIDGETGTLLESKVIYDVSFTWFIALYTYRDLLVPGKPVSKLDNIYWITLGLWKELLTKFMFNLYKDYPYRAVPLDKLLKIADQGVPACLFRQDTNTMEIVDRYNFPDGYMVSSPQFIPRSDGDNSSTNGYIVCAVFAPERNEIWIFDAENLKQPKCKLYDPKSSLNFGLSIHTTWLPKIGRRTASYCIPVREDYDPIVKKKSREIQELFEQEVYPQFENPVNHS
jgi:carotenoid cleavage dioxygenase-like enzyme